MTTSSKTAKRPLRHMTQKQIDDNASAAPDNRPLSRADLHRLKRMAQVNIIRRALGKSRAGASGHPPQ
jgi:hypothetical protein